MIARFLTVPGLPPEDIVARSRGEVLGELRALVSLQQDDRHQLAAVRAHELRLVTAIDYRARKIDPLLDELTALHIAEELETLG